VISIVGYLDCYCERTARPIVPLASMKSTAEMTEARRKTGALRRTGALQTMVVRQMTTCGEPRRSARPRR
jgi:hypothetical protein